MKIDDYMEYYIQGSDHYLIPKDIFDELFHEVTNWKEECMKLEKQLKIKHNGFMVSVEESCEFAEENQKYKETIDKAIKYIKANEFYLDYSTGACIKGVMPLLNILNEVDE